MRLLRRPVVCDRVRAQISVDLDGELSQLERAMLASHLERCADCRSYAAEVTAFTQALRDEPLEGLERPVVVVRRSRRVAAVRLPAAVAAVMAIAVVGVSSQIAANQTRERALSSRTELHFPTQDELEREQTLIESASSLSASGAKETVK
jgi:predicted anti-sigma-YlaC factor YlaD